MVNLVTNGGAENGMTGWSYSSAWTYCGCSSVSGSNVFYIPSNPSSGWLNQTISLKAGNYYQVYFWVRGGGSGFTGSGVKLSINDDLLISMTITEYSFVQESSVYLAQNSFATLQIYGFNIGTTQVVIDDITVVEISNPTTSPSSPTLVPTSTPTSMPTNTPTIPTPTNTPTIKPTMSAKNLLDIDLANLVPNSGFKIVGAAYNDQSGTVSGAGDVNGDGYDDFIIGAPYADDSGADAGTVYVIYGNKDNLIDIDLINLNMGQGFKIFGEMYGKRLGFSVGGAGDINKDGFADIIIGSLSSYPYTYIIFGKSNNTNIELKFLDSAQGFSLKGESSYYNSGSVCRGAGDINKDGYDDIIIGIGEGGQGKSYLIFGKKNGFSNIDLATNIAQTGQGFKIYGAEQYSGASVAGTDINNDGYSDLIIGELGYDRTGTTYVIFGKASGFTDINLASLTSAQGFKIWGVTSNDYSGQAVASAGDVNGDGYNDIIIGAYGSDPMNGLRQDAGTSYLIFGKSSGFTDIYLASLTSSQGFKILGAASNDYSGQSVDSAGDVNGDGYSDVIIGAPQADPNGRSNAGTSYVIFGKASGFADVDLASLTSTQGFKILGAAIDDQSGYYRGVSGLGDINNDGYADVIVGATYSSPNGKSDAGTSYLIYDSSATVAPTSSPSAIPTMSPTPKPTIVPTSSPTSRPTAIPSAKPTFQPSSNPTFAPTNIPSTSSPSASPSATPTNIPTTSKPSASPSASPTKSPSMPPKGDTSMDLAIINPNQGIEISGIIIGDGTGFSVSSAGDVNGDGYMDVLISSHLADYNSRTNSGATYVIYGLSSGFANIDLSNLSLSQGFKIYGSNSGEQSGYSISSISDINKDGYSDIIIGSPYANSETGISYVIFGQGTNFISNIDLISLTNAQGFKILGASPVDRFGSSLSGAGDINGDGFNDIIIGAYLADGNGKADSGISYIIFGKPSFSTINLASLTSAQGIKISGATAGDNSGYSVSGAGDFNGDGYDDVIVGAYQADSNGRAYAGTSYLIFGKSSLSDIDLASLSSSVGFKILGAASGDYSGYSVSGLDDINGDGYSDIVIGAYLADSNGKTDAGVSYVIYGKASGFVDIDLASLSSAEGFKIIGASSNDYSGFSVSRAGDLNKDGYADIIIGVYCSNVNSKQDAGASYVIFGKPGAFSDIDLSSLTSNQGFKVSGANANDWSGYSVASAGDFNKDGYGDIIIGAYAQGSAGKAYIVYESAATASPSFTPTAAPSAPTRVPTIIKTLEPTAQIQPTHSPTLMTESTWFTAISPVASFLASLVGGYILREKIIFHILSNWGYKYKLVHEGDQDPLEPGEIGFSISHDDRFNTDRLVCKNGEKTINVEIDNGNNNGLPEGIYKIILDELKQQAKLESFSFLPSEKNKILHFLLSRPEFLDFRELGYIKGNIYKILLDTDYKKKYEDKYKFGVRRELDNYNEADIESAKDLGLNGNQAANIRDADIEMTFLPNKPIDDVSSPKLEESKSNKEAVSSPSLIETIVESDNPPHNSEATNIDTSIYHSEVIDSNDLSKSSENPAIGAFKREHSAHDIGILIKEAEIEKIVSKTDNPMHQDKLATNIDQVSEDIASAILTRAKELAKLEQLNGGDQSIESKHPEREAEFVRALTNILAENYQELVTKASKNNELPQLVENISVELYDTGEIFKVSSKVTLQGSKKLFGINEHFESQLEIFIAKLNEVLSAVSSRLLGETQGKVLLCIDLMPDEIALQHKAFIKFAEQLMLMTKESFCYSNLDGKNLLGTSTLHQESTLDSNAKFSTSDNLLISLLSARQLIEYLPLFKYMTQGTLNQLGYNVTLPEFLDDKALLITMHLMLGIAAAQCLPADLVTTGMLVSNIGTGSYAIRLMLADYLKTQQPSDEPLEIAAQCGAAMLLYNLPNIATYAAVQLMLPGAAYTITGYDVLASSSMGAIHCASNYKTITKQPVDLTTADTIVPLIIDAGILLLLGSNLQLSASSIGMLMVSMKNVMSVATTIYAADSVTRMVMDVVPEEVKEEYIEPMFKYAYNITTAGIDNVKQVSGDVIDYFSQDAEL